MAQKNGLLVWIYCAFKKIFYSAPLGINTEKIPHVGFIKYTVYK